jgi:uncharacterized membrane protein (DUF4010 family)
MKVNGSLALAGVTNAVVNSPALVATMMDRQRKRLRIP